MWKNAVDQMGRTIEVRFPPKRIVSLVPSQTELLHHLGLEREVVGITKFCIHPESWFKNKTRVGGTKTLHLDKIRALNPDLIIGNKEENTQSDIESLQKSYAVWMSDIYTLKDSLEMINQLGELTNTCEKAAETIGQIKTGWKNIAPIKTPLSALYLIWEKPWMAVGKNTFTDDLLGRLGFKNALSGKRYPKLTQKDLEKIKPDIVFLSSEPFPFTEKHAAEIKAILPEATVHLVDGEMFSWYGSRLIEAVSYFETRLTEWQRH